jgi:hypothetical protein
MLLISALEEGDESVVGVNVEPALEVPYIDNSRRKY